MLKRTDKYKANSCENLLLQLVVEDSTAQPV